MQYLVKNNEDKPIKNKHYILFDVDGNTLTGVTDKNGFMKLTFTPSSQALVARVVVNDIEYAEDDIIK